MIKIVHLIKTNMIRMKNQILILTLFLLTGLTVLAQDIPQHISYTKIYDFLDEMASEKLIELNSAVKPYSRAFIADKLLEIEQQKSTLNKRQQDELYFFMAEFALERNSLPDYDLPLLERDNIRIDLLPPVFTYRDTLFRARIQPLLGMNVYKNNKGTITQRWYGVDFQSAIGKNISVYGSLRDISFSGFGNARLSDSTYLTPFAGYQYKEPSDYSDSRGGIKYATKWGSIGLVKDNISWGDNNHGSNILSGRAPSFPMLTLNIKPVSWFELNYIHGWLVSNVRDSANYYIDSANKIFYRNHNKFIAANMITITPFRHFNFSLGNSIIYAENNIHPGYLIPIAFYKSIDHTLTKGIGTENENSQMFLNISSRNIKHLHLFASIYVDEFNTARLKPANKETNPVSIKVGGKLTNFPIDNLSLSGEYTRNNIIVYKHSIDVLTWQSNSYNLGHYLGDNSQEIYISLGYKPIRSLEVNLNYIQAKHGNDYNYIRRTQNNTNVIKNVISQPFMNDVIWSNQSIELNTLYEIFNNIYARVNIQSSNIQGFDASSTAILGENRMTAQQVLNKYTPAFLQGKTTTITFGLNFGF